MFLDLEPAACWASTIPIPSPKVKLLKVSCFVVRWCMLSVALSSCFSLPNVGIAVTTPCESLPLPFTNFLLLLTYKIGYRWCFHLCHSSLSSPIPFLSANCFLSAFMTYKFCYFLFFQAFSLFLDFSPSFWRLTLGDFRLKSCAIISLERGWNKLNDFRCLLGHYSTLLLNLVILSH